MVTALRPLSAPSPGTRVPGDTDPASIPQAPTQALSPHPSPSEGPGRVSEERPRTAAFRPLSCAYPPCPGHLPGRGGRRALPELAPPVQPRRGQRAQRGCHARASRGGRGGARCAGTVARLRLGMLQRRAAPRDGAAGRRARGSRHRAGRELTLHTAICKGSRVNSE